MLDLEAIFNPDDPPPGAGYVPRRPPRAVLPRAVPEYDASDWLEFLTERAAIREVEGKLPRDRAEALALRDLIEEMTRAGTHPWN